MARRTINPYWGVELAGWGYYLERIWTEVRDDLHATACCVEPDQGAPVAVVALDLMTISTEFTQRVRQLASQATAIPAENILLTASHSHNAPTAGALLGVGDEDPDYVEWAAREAATAIILAWRNREPAALAPATTRCGDLTFNRTRNHGATLPDGRVSDSLGPIDDSLTTLRIDSVARDKPLGFIVNFQAHPTVMTNLMPATVTRDIPGVICDQLEKSHPGAMAMYIQGACGDVNFHREFQTPSRICEPGERLATLAADACGRAPVIEPVVRAAVATIHLPVRPWTQDELEHDRAEGARRLAEQDLTGWRDTIGRVMVNQPNDMVDRHGGDEWKAVEAMCRFQVEWTDRMSQQPTVDSLATEIQAIRLGDLVIVANATEFFTTLALDVRERTMAPHVMVAAYSNGRIGYLPDAHDVERKTYAAYQSPKYCSQPPFTAESGPAMCDAMIVLANQLTND